MMIEGLANQKRFLLDNPYIGSIASTQSLLKNKLRLHRRLLLLLFICFVCLVFSILHTLFREIPQSELQHHALNLQQNSVFNPRVVSYNIYAYIHRSFIDKRAPGKSFIKAGSALGNDMGIYFHWDDWVDMLSVDTLQLQRDVFPEGQCDGEARSIANINPYYMESYRTKVQRGMFSLYCQKDIPKNILVATDDGYYKVPVLAKRRLGLAEASQDISKGSVVLEMKACDELRQSTSVGIDGSIRPSTSPVKFIPAKSMKTRVFPSASDFVFEPEVQIFSLKEKLNENNLLIEGLQYLEFLESANSNVDSADRFFKYPWIYGDVVAGRSHHLYAPFFKRYIPDRERQSILQHMIRAWFRFAAAEDVASWINSGSLLGWAFNGVNMPWDTDTDLQLPIAQLDRLSQKYNNTIITENPRDGNSMYLFEVSPTYIRQGNGRNFIDARFIDINSGVYLDISALSHTNDQPPSDMYKSRSDISRLKAMEVHCKHWNWLLLDELLPLRLTSFEGSSVYVPNNVSAILSRQYGKESFTSKLAFKGHEFRSDLGMWVPQSLCKPSQKQFDPEDPEQLWVNACGLLWLLDEFRINFAYSNQHRAVNIDSDHMTMEGTERDFDQELHRKDAWDYYNDINNRAVSSYDWFIGD